MTKHGFTLTWQWHHFSTGQRRRYYRAECLCGWLSIHYRRKHLAQEAGIAHVAIRTEATT